MVPLLRTDRTDELPVTRTYHRRLRSRKAAFAVALFVLAAAYGFRRWRPFRVEVSGPSMRPTLEPGDRAIAIELGRVRPGDVVVVEHPERPGFEMVKRVRSAAGDHAPDGTEPVAGVWVEGDDPSTSTDSRSFGTVPADLVRGRVALVWWPPARIRIVR
jgi:nickel-type superoxide dismutase maturation protease